MPQKSSSSLGAFLAASRASHPYPISHTRKRGQDIWTLSLPYSGAQEDRIHDSIRELGIRCREIAHRIPANAERPRRYQDPS